MENLTTESITDYLLQEDILTAEDVDEVNITGLTREEKVRRLLGKLSRKDQSAYDRFLEVLRQDTCTEHHATSIEDTDVTEQDIRWIIIGNYNSSDFGTAFSVFFFS